MTRSAHTTTPATPAAPHPAAPAKRRTAPRGFTLIEMLVVLGLVAMMLGITLPTLNFLMSASRGSAAANSVSVAVNAARIYNHRQSEDDDLGIAGADYSGTGAIFSPAGNIRLVKNNQQAENATPAYLESLGFEAYRDISGIDYVTVPRSSGVVGVRYESGDLEVLAPPFAIRFNQHGQLARDIDVIYYDHDYDGVYNTSAPAQRPADYDPDIEDPRLDSSITPNETTGRYELPFEEIETVSGVIVYNARKFRTSGVGWDDSAMEERVAWMLDNGNAINFSPLSGLAITDQ